MPCRLRELRESEGLSQTAVAEGAGIARSRIQTLENNEGISPTIATLQKCADFLGCDLWDLWDAKTKKKRKKI